MYKQRVFVSIVVLTYILFVVFEFTGNEVLAKKLDAFILPIITLGYLFLVKNRALFFTLFVVFYTASDLLALSDNYVSKEIDYYLGNILYIIAYIFLLIEICKTLSFSHVFKNYKIHLVVLLALSIYVVYVLQVIMNPHAKVSNKYYLELIYNITILILLSVSLLNFFYNDNKKALYLFIGVLCIVFSEVIWVAYLYITEKSLLNVISKTLMLLAFYFFYMQSGFLNEDKEKLRMTI